MAFNQTLVPFFTKDSTTATFASKCYPVTPSDTVDVLDPVTGLYFKYLVAKSAGDVAVLGYQNLDADPAVVITVSAGQVVPGRIRRVKATGTTATLCGWSD